MVRAMLGVVAIAFACCVFSVGSGQEVCVDGTCALRQAEPSKAPELPVVSAVVNTTRNAVSVLVPPYPALAERRAQYTYSRQASPSYGSSGSSVAVTMGYGSSGSSSVAYNTFSSQAAGYGSSGSGYGSTQPIVRRGLLQRLFGR